ncbi:MAG: hypothetical protein AAF499_04625 [Pseudomonadota bacterium]
MEIDKKTQSLSDQAAARAAWEIHTQLSTRVTTVRMRYRDGDDEAALTSVYSLFKSVREAVDKAGPAGSQVALRAIKMLNDVVRPFTAHWHQQLSTGKLHNNDERRRFRDGLRSLQKDLLPYQKYFLRASYKPRINFDTFVTALNGDDIAEAVLDAAPLDTINARRAAAVGRGDHQACQSVHGVSADTVVNAELIHVHKRRHSQQSDGEADPVLGENLVGLCLSGGGIRSATFALGVLHSLAQRGLLRHVDYLSTVSGGGYLGGYIISQLRAETRLASESDAPGEARGAAHLLRDEYLFKDLADDQGESPAEHLRNSSAALGREKLGALMLWLKGIVVNALLLSSVAGFCAAMIWLAIESSPAYRSIPFSHFTGVEHVLTSVWLGLLLIFVGLISVLVLWLVEIAYPDYYNARQYKVWERRGALAVTAGFILCVATQYWTLLDGQASGGALVALHAELFGASLLVALAVSTGAYVLPYKWLSTLAAATALPAKCLFAVLGVLLALACVVAWESKVSNATGFIVALTVLCLLVFCLIGYTVNIDRIIPARYYRRHLQRTYFKTRETQRGSAAVTVETLRGDVDLHHTPYPLINATLNLPSSPCPSLRGRQSEVFLLSPLYCGASLLGYFENTRTGWGKLPYVTAVATSGAAASPLMGRNTRPTLAPWMAALNVRLALWAPNINSARQPDVAPIGGPANLLWQELGARADEHDPYINLSDGGHSENLGVYELLRRRCQLIVCVDAEADADLQFDGMIRLIRLAKIDFDVDIDIDLDDIRRQRSGYSYSHFALGRIRYPRYNASAPQSEATSATHETGYLLYIKSSLTGNETETVTDFHRQFPKFPHQSTLDQFFSEAQFESYRALGQHVGNDLFTDFFCENWFVDILEDLGATPSAQLDRDAEEREREIMQFGAREDVQWFFTRLVQMLRPEEFARLRSERSPYLSKPTA